MTAFQRDTRGVSTAVSYTLAVGITVVLVSGLFISMGGVMDGHADRATDSELGIIAESIGTELTKVDRIADRRDDATFALRVDAPKRVASEPYTIDLEESGDLISVTVATDDRLHTIDVELITGIDEDAASTDGGTMWIVADDDGLSLQEARP